MWCCPNCGSGTHGTPSSDGALSITPDGSQWHCFACHAGGDVFDLAGIIYKTDDKREQLERVASWARVELDVEKPVASIKAKAERRTEQTPRDYTQARQREADYIKRMRQNIGHPEAVSYLSGRGITSE